MRKFFTIFLTVLFISMLLAGCNTRSEYTNLINISPVGFTVSITSLPNGASVFVNNEYKGITPCGVSLKKGTYRFIVIKDDYISQRKDIKIVENTNLNFELKKPKIKGTLNSISFDELKGGIVFDELFISRQENEIACISLATGKELWRKNFNNTTNFMLADNTLCLENQKREEATETSPRKFIEEIFAVNSYSGETIKSSKFEIVPDEKNTILWLSNIGDDVAFFEEFILTYGGIPNVIYLKAYSLKDDKLLYNRKFIAEPSNMPIFGDHLHLFGSSDGHLIIYKVDKFKGTTLSQMEFPEIKSSNIGFNVETLDTDGEKVVVQTFSTASYIIDLEKQKIVYKAKGNPLVQGGRYIVFFDEYNSGDNLLTEVTDVTSMKQIGFITYDIKEESKVMYPFVTLPVYDSQNRRIFIFINDKMFCFNEEGKELPLPEIFKSSYRHLLNVIPADVPGISIEVRDGLIILTQRDTGKEAVSIYDGKTFEPIFSASSPSLLLENNLILFNVSIKGNPSQNSPDRGTLTIIDLNEFISK